MSKTTNFEENGLKPHDRLNSSRRSFLKYGGATLATAGLVVSGCKEFHDFLPKKLQPDKVRLGSGDIGILNYAYALEQLEAAFYTLVVAADHGLSYEEFRVLDDLRQHEVAHRDFFKAALGDKAIPQLTFDFSSVNFLDRESVLATAKTFENLGVAAYNGAGKLLENTDFLVVAGKIVSVEARHAAVIFELIHPDDAFVDFISDGLDRALPPSEVLEQASPFIINKIDASNLPTA